MTGHAETRCTAFAGTRRIAAGALAEVALKAKKAADRGDDVLIFDDATSEPIEVDFRGSARDVAARLNAPAPAPAEPEAKGPGRPKLGVVAREVTLLPRHWDWLNSQPGGASVALRKLVDEARRMKSGQDRVRRAQERAYRFMYVVAGNLRGFKDATRALFAGDAERFGKSMANWPKDVRKHAQTLAAGCVAGLTREGRAPARKCAGAFIHDEYFTEQP